MAALLAPHRDPAADRRGRRRRVVAALALVACLGTSTAATLEATSDLHQAVEHAQARDAGQH
ncbi:hypothetical protein [Streptomyces tateyamensis]|uniref:hypothetical protein n=1 Tax=Streptomyces tateyamensis TaxID=565073 RepID=UPI0015E8AEF4|nr:hypothetical protein [Streptomyces tateyamensis]